MMLMLSVMQFEEHPGSNACLSYRLHEQQEAMFDCHADLMRTRKPWDIDGPGAWASARLLSRSRQMQDLMAEQIALTNCGNLQTYTDLLSGPGCSNRTRQMYDRYSLMDQNGQTTSNCARRAKASTLQQVALKGSFRQDTKAKQSKAVQPAWAKNNSEVEPSIS